MIGDLVEQTSTTTGTGNFTLAAVNGRRTYAAVFGTGASTNVFYYYIASVSSTDWEMGMGHMSDATTLVRDTVLLSSNANAIVNFPAGSKTVVNDLPADRQKPPLMFQVDLVQTAGNVNISSAPSAFDGVSGVSGYTVLLTAQTTQSQNGVYTFNGTGAAMTRVSWQNNDHTIRGASIWPKRGSSNQGIVYQNTNLSAITVGTTAITYVRAVQASTGLFYTGRFIGLNNTGVTGGSYIYGANYTAQFGVNYQGQLTNAYVTPISISWTQVYDFVSGVEAYASGISRAKAQALAENSGA